MTTSKQQSRCLRFYTLVIVLHSTHQELLHISTSLSHIEISGDTIRLHIDFTLSIVENIQIKEHPLYTSLIHFFHEVLTRYRFLLSIKFQRTLSLSPNTRSLYEHVQYQFLKHTIKMIIDSYNDRYHIPLNSLTIQIIDYILLVIF